MSPRILRRLVSRPHRLLAVAIGALLITACAAPAGAIERRRDQFGKDFSYFVYPIASEIPGLGTATGAGASVLNLFETDADFTGFVLRGDFDASGYALLDLHLLPRTLILDVGYFDYRVAPTSYSRGIDSDPNDYILPEVEGAWSLGQLTYTVSERRFETYLRLATGRQRLIRVLDRDGRPFEAVDTSTKPMRQATLGAILDWTDDRLDPRVGLRVEVVRRRPRIDDPLRSEYDVQDYNITGYIPFRQWDTLALNVYRSDAIVTHKGVTDYATLQALAGLNCGALPPGPEQQACLATEAKQLSLLIASNEHGTATSLGGTQRLRSYPNYRFYAGHAFFYGAEYRWNLTDEHTPFDIFIAKGVRTGLQVAFFAEQGTVSDDPGELYHNLRTSYGTGFRVVLSGVVIRADAATGDEGSVFQLFINYPWSTFSVDSPG